MKLFNKDLDAPCEVPTRESMGFKFPCEVPARQDLDLPFQVPTRLSLGCSCLRKMLVECLLDVCAVFIHPLPWKRYLFSMNYNLYNYIYSASGNIHY